MSFVTYINDWRWAMNVKRARAWRRKCLFSQRLKFDAALRPKIGDGQVIDYPDALYHITIDDLCRAITESVSRPGGE